MFDVEVMWSNQLDLEAAKSSFCERAIDTVLYIHQHEDDGDVLVFLTGQFEIENACKVLQQKFNEISPQKSEKLLIYPIYASLDSLDQKAIFDKTPKGHRKVIFATNIAQTSITIPGIRFVVDSGFVKQKMYDPKSGMDALLTVPISQAAATQRAGRAGRCSFLFFLF
jgi:HrpA-like RNA helicase